METPGNEQIGSLDKVYADLGLEMSDEVRAGLEEKPEVPEKPEIPEDPKGG